MSDTCVAFPLVSHPLGVHTLQYTVCLNSLYQCLSLAPHCLCVPELPKLIVCNCTANVAALKQSSKEKGADEVAEPKVERKSGTSRFSVSGGASYSSSGQQHRESAWSSRMGWGWFCTATARANARGCSYLPSDNARKLARQAGVVAVGLVRVGDWYDVVQVVRAGKVKQLLLSAVIHSVTWRCASCTQHGGS